jgi:hypothetical protein
VASCGKRVSADIIRPEPEMGSSWITQIDFVTDKRDAGEEVMRR